MDEVFVRIRTAQQYPARIARSRRSYPHREQRAPAT
jgi:hypothetical protein